MAARCRARIRSRSLPRQGRKTVALEKSFAPVGACLSANGNHGLQPWLRSDAASRLKTEAFLPQSAGRSRADPRRSCSLRVERGGRAIQKDIAEGILMKARPGWFHKGTTPSAPS